MNKRIVILSPQLGMAPESNSGGEVYDRETIKALCIKGVKVVVILPLAKPYIKNKNLKVYYLPIPFVWPPYLFNLFIIPYLFMIYKKYKFNILRIHSPYFVGLGALFFKLFHSRIPIVATYHHLEDKKIFFEFINKIFIKKWNSIICDSKFTRNDIQHKYTYLQEKTSVVYAGIEKKFKPEKKDKSLIKKYNLKRYKILLFLGEFKVRKNLFFLLKLFSLLDIYNIKLLLCGKGVLESRLRKQTDKLKIGERVIFTGFIPENQKVKYYNLADVFVFPSKLEGFGMPVIEAAACRIPSIVSKRSSLKELVINGKTGYLAEFNDIKDWKYKIETLLKNDYLRKKMGKEAQKFTKQFSWLKSAEKQIGIYKQLLDKKKINL